MLEFLRRNRIVLASAAFLLLSASLVVTTSGERTRVDRVGGLVLDVMAPVLRLAAFASQAVGGTWRRAVELVRARDDVRLLRAQADELLHVSARLAEVEGENARLRDLIGLRERLAGEMVAARVIGRDATGVARTLAIDRGTAAGILEGAAVVAPAGVVGHVFAVGRTAARVLLVTDHNSGVDGLIQRTRATGIVKGRLDAGCGLEYVKRTEDLQVGDLVVTSGLDGVFPKGLPIGRVTVVDKRGQGLFQDAIVTPHVDFERLEEVLVARAPFTLVPEEEPVQGPEPPPGFGATAEAE